MKRLTNLLTLLSLFFAVQPAFAMALEFVEEPIEDNPLIWNLKKGNGYDYLLKDDHGRMLVLHSVRQGLRDYLLDKLKASDEQWLSENSLESIGQLYQDHLVRFPYTKKGHQWLLMLENKEKEYENALKAQFSMEEILKPLKEHEENIETKYLKEAFEGFSLHESEPPRKRAKTVQA